MPPRKPLLIRPPVRSNGAMNSEEALEANWNTLCSAFNEIHRKNSSKLSFEELYRTAYNMVLQRQGSQLYERTKQSLETYLRSVLDTRLRLASDQDLLTGIRQLWMEYQLSLSLIRDILMYLDRVYVKSAKVPPISEMGVAVFRDSVVDIADDQTDKSICDRLCRALLHLITAERQGELVDRGLIKSITEMFYILPSNGSTRSSSAAGGNIKTDVATAAVVQAPVQHESSKTIYEMKFEPIFLEATGIFYAAESTQFLGANDVPSYLLQVEKRLAEENDRMAHYLQRSTAKKLTEILVNRLIEENVQQNLLGWEKSGLLAMLRDRRLEDVKRLFQLLNMSDRALEEMRSQVAMYIRERGREIQQSLAPETGPSSKPVAATGSLSARWMSEMCALQAYFTDVLCQSLNGDNRFQTCVEDALQTIVNSTPRAAEMLAIYVDENFNRRSRNTDQQTELAVRQTVEIFRYLQDKDVFERYYKQYLAKRLLGGKSLSEDTERLLITQFKSECGHQFTSRMEGMFNDINLNEDLAIRFNQYLLDNNSATTTLPFEFNCKVLTLTNWPISTADEFAVQLPPDFERCQTLFKRFYDCRHSGRKLSWQYMMGSVDLKAYFGSNSSKYEISVNPLQSMILLLFNDHSQLSFTQVARLLGLDPETNGEQRRELIRHMQSLACAKFKVLSKHSKGSAVSAQDLFSVNDGFRSPQLRFKIPMIAQKSAEEINDADKENRRRIEEERSHLTNAALVRIMKSRRTLDHQQLIIEASKQLSLRFIPDPVLIKRQIEHLIEKEYLGRDNIDRKIYRYIA